MFWLKNKKINFLVGTLNLSPDKTLGLVWVQNVCTGKVITSRETVKVTFSMRTLSQTGLKIIRIYHVCEGRIENQSRGSPFGITRLAE